MTDKKTNVYIDWESLKLKPITREQKKSQKLSAIGNRKASINKIRKMIRDDMKNDLIKIDSFNNKGRKNGSKDS
tara:strand:+ start:2844 stop:3065 length:222 start_codon:yes stop_codon:yes gene_type:complete